MENFVVGPCRISARSWPKIASHHGYSVTRHVFDRMTQRLDTSLVRGDHAWTPPAHLPCSCRLLLSARKGEHQSTLHTLCHSHATLSPSLALLACATARHGWPGEARRRHCSSTSAPPRPQSSVELSPSPHAASDTPLPRSRPWPANSTDGAAVRSAAGVRGLTTMSPL